MHAGASDPDVGWFKCYSDSDSKDSEYRACDFGSGMLG